MLLKILIYFNINVSLFLFFHHDIKLLSYQFYCSKFIAQEISVLIIGYKIFLFLNETALKFFLKFLIDKTCFYKISIILNITEISNFFNEIYDLININSIC